MLEKLSSCKYENNEAKEIFPNTLICVLIILKLFFTALDRIAKIFVIALKHVEAFSVKTP